MAGRPVGRAGAVLLLLFAVLLCCSGAVKCALVIEVGADANAGGGDVGSGGSGVVGGGCGAVRYRRTILTLV